MAFLKQLLLPLTLHSINSVYLEQYQGLHSLYEGVKCQGLDSIYNWHSKNGYNSLQGPFLQPLGLLGIQKALSRSRYGVPAHAPHLWLPAPWAPAWTLPSEMLRNWAPGSNLGNWLEAITMEEKEETGWWKTICRETRTAGGNTGGIERRENGIAKGQKMNRKRHLEKWDLNENSQRGENRNIFSTFIYLFFSHSFSFIHWSFLSSAPLKLHRYPFSQLLLTRHATFLPLSLLWSSLALHSDVIKKKRSGF